MGEVGIELCRVGAHGGSKGRDVAFAVDALHGAVERPGCALIVIVLVVVTPVECGDVLVLCGERCAQAFIVHEVELHVARLLALDHHGVVVEACAGGRGLLNPGAAVLVVEHNAIARADDVHAVLLAVERGDHQVASHVGQLGNVVSPDGRCGELAAGQMIGAGRHLGVFLARYGIFVVERAGIERKVGVGMAVALVECHGVHGYLAFVPAQERELAVVGAPADAVQHSELFLVHPVGHAVGDVVFQAVGGHLDVLPAVEAVHKDVSVAHIGHLAATAGHGGNLDRPSGAHGREAALAAVVGEVFGLERMSVDGLGARPEQNHILIGAHLITVPAGEGVGHDVLGQNDRGASRFVLYPVDGRAVHLVVVACVGGGAYLADGGRPALAQRKVLQRQGVRRDDRN